MDWGTMSDIASLERLAKDANNALHQAKRDIAEARRAQWRKCHWCKKTDEDNFDDGYGSLIDFTIVTSEGEEGYSRVVRFACQEHYEWLQPELEKLGFYVHAHGGICFLEAQTCPGANGGECPTPEDPIP